MSGAPAVKLAGLVPKPIAKWERLADCDEAVRRAERCFSPVKKREVEMTLKFGLLPAVAFGFATAAAAQTPTMDQTTSWQSQPAASQSQQATATPTNPDPQTTATSQSTTLQTTPGTCQCPPAATSQTSSQETASEVGTTAQAAQTAQVTQAKAGDIKAGASVYDQSGALVGKVDSVDADGAIVSTGKARAEVPLSSFGQNEKGLVVSVTKSELDAQATAKKVKPKN